MRHVTVFLFLLGTLSLAIGIYFLYEIPNRQSIEQARSEYDRVRDVLLEKSQLQRQKNRHFDALQHQIDSVELDARRQFRLIRPGEKIGMLEYSRSEVIDPLAGYRPLKANP
jgi:hypothetical protein